MERMIQAAPQGGTLFVKARGDLNMCGWDQNSFEVVADPTRVRISVEGLKTQITTLDDCTIQVPMYYPVVVEKVNCSAWLQDLLGQVKVERVGGDLSATRMANLAVDKVGGDCVVDEIAAPLTCSRVGGDLVCRALGDGLADAFVGGDARLVNIYGSVRVSCGGDIVAGFSESAGKEIALKAGGDVKASIPPSSGWSLDLTSGGEDIRLELMDGTERVDDWALLRIIGDGSTLLRIKAGGDIRITDQPVANEKMDRKARKREEHWQHVGTWAVPGISVSVGADGLSSDISERIARKTSEAVRRAESRIEAAMRKMEEKGYAPPPVESQNFFQDEAIPSPDGAVFEQPVSGVTEEERLVVLRMLQDKKLTVDEADKLLDALEYSAQ